MSLPWYLSGGLALACAGLYAWVQVATADVETKRTKIDELEAAIARQVSDIAQAKLTNQGNLDEIARLTADLNRQAEVAYRFEALARERATKLNAVLKRIADAPASDDGPVAPVLRLELERLRADYVAAGGADQGPDRAPAGP